MSDSAILLKRYVEEDCEAAFSELVTRYVNLVYSTALRRLGGDGALAEDITQIVFTDLARKSASIASNTQLAGWLYRDACYRTSELIRNNRRRVRREETSMELQDDSATSSSTWTQLAPVLDEALQKLQETDRVAILLRFFEAMDFRSLGVTLGISEDAAQKRISRALEKLRKILAKQSIKISPGLLTTLLGSQFLTIAPTGLAVTVSAGALTSAAASTTVTSGLLNILLMSKAKLTLAAALITVAAPLVWQHQTIGKLKSENQVLESNFGQVSKQLAALESTLTNDVTNNSLTKLERRDLMRLRNEVTLLRNDSQQLAAIRKADRSPRATEEAGLLLAESWANVGVESPEAALQTFFWAAKNENKSFVTDLIRWNPDASVQAMEGVETLMPSLVPGTVRFVSKLEGIRILSQEQTAPDATRVKVEFRTPNKPNKVEELLFVKENSEWKPVFQVWSAEPGSVRATLGNLPVKPGSPN